MSTTSSQECSCPFCHLGRPTIRFAEDNLCGYIAQPANTWSNLAFVVVAVLIWRELYRLQSKSVLWGFVPISVSIGVFSGFYHASYSFVGQFLDFASMYLLSGYMLFLSLDRYKLFKTKSLLLGISFVTFLLLIALWYMPNLRIWLFAAQIILFLWFEFRFLKNSPNRTAYFKFLYFALLTFLVSWGFWWLDYLLIWKDINTMHWINGHAIWHIGSSLALYFIYKYFASTTSELK